MWKHIKMIYSRILAHPLTKDHPIEALSRYFSWQLYYRLNKEFKIVSWIGDLKLKLRKDIHAVNAQYYFGLADFNEMSFMLHFLREDDLLIDVGAYQGMYTLLAAGINKSRVISFEPDKLAYSMLVEHVSLNHLDALVECRQTALGETSGTIGLTKNKGQQNFIDTNGTPGGNVKLSTLDIELMGSNEPCLLKIDAEGYELNILKGGKDILKSSTLKAVIIEMMDLGKKYNSSDVKVHDSLIKEGFQAFHYDPFKRELEIHPGIPRGNGIYIRDIEFVKKRIKEASPFSILGKTI